MAVLLASVYMGAEVEIDLLKFFIPPPPWETKIPQTKQWGGGGGGNHLGCSVRRPGYHLVQNDAEIPFLKRKNSGRSPEIDTV